MKKRPRGAWPLLLWLTCAVVLADGENSTGSNTSATTIVTTGTTRSTTTAATAASSTSVVTATASTSLLSSSTVSQKTPANGTTTTNATTSGNSSGVTTSAVITDTSALSPSVVTTADFENSSLSGPTTVRPSLSDLTTGWWSTEDGEDSSRSAPTSVPASLDICTQQLSIVFYEAELLLDPEDVVGDEDPSQTEVVFEDEDDEEDDDDKETQKEGKESLLFPFYLQAQCNRSDAINISTCEYSKRSPQGGSSVPGWPDIDRVDFVPRNLTKCDHGLAVIVAGNRTFYANSALTANLVAGIYNVLGLGDLTSSFLLHLRQFTYPARPRT
ncbi:protein UL116 [Panine betaherpesvirus 2]|uniref:Protein UL116 n=1 Tax=Panine betaherpesvirus 2 TaxID=188763 RepID=Q8QRZ2_9BETA|nr:protein UL116 [Panine betaherpesvirus 2]AAM00746.1 protein UL116 [Panine betaherpesvirus 2]QXV67860.1 protein UL116 [Panine betaherpesvirus 2]